MNSAFSIRRVLWFLSFAVIVVLVITSITHGDIQEFCATAVYVGMALCAVLLIVECVLERRRGGIAD